MSDKQKIKWHTETRRLAELKVFDANPRKIGGKSYEDLKKSLNKFGVAEPIVINMDNVVIGGHARVIALKDIGEKETAVWLPDRLLSEKEVKELNIRLNKNIAGEWDFDILANNFEVQDLLEWGFEMPELVGKEAEEVDISDFKDVITVEAPETVYLKERLSFYCDNPEQYKMIKAYFGGDTKIEISKLLDLLK